MERSISACLPAISSSVDHPTYFPWYNLAELDVDDDPCSLLRLSHKKTSLIIDFYPGRNRPKRKHTKSRDRVSGQSGQIYSKKTLQEKEGNKLKWGRRRTSRCP